ncbi:hypothetical protein K6U21_05275 [Vibrio vulnificus]|uniref:Ig-like domain-containing protein n=1 Tax=Vibrio vulnificus TaxID=672 RepID=UPI001EEBAF04|nr:hypothetical protein [Vibrio vulnificus]MCG6303605.1 hypothetical protein [Vibrio vulnificus]
MIAAVFIACFLAACKGGPEDASPSTPSTPSGSSSEQVDITALDSIDKMFLGQSQIVEVTAVTDPDIKTEITDITLGNNEAGCEVELVSTMSLNVRSTQVGECRFAYKVKPVDEESYVGGDTGLVRVSVSNTGEENTLPNLSQVTDLMTPIAIDLNQELADEIDTSRYVLSDDLTILGQGTATADITTNTILFTPSDIGVSRILYSMSDGSVTKLGEVDVAVSGSENTPPYAMNYQYDGTLAKGMVATIDLTDLVSDVEDAVILDSVSAYNAEVLITSANEHTFTFKSSDPGTHQVAYTITDGRGGYDVAQVEIVVEPDFSLVQDWNDITIFDATISADLTFTAPLSKVMADYTNTSYSQTVVQDGLTGPSGAETVTMNLEQAQNYCATRGGRLPIKREWELLLSSNGNLFQSHNWPGSNNFWSADMASELEGIGFNIIDADSTQSAKNAGVNVVSCVLLDSPAVKEFSTIIDYNTIETSNLKKQLSFKVFDPDGNNAPYQDIDAEIVDQKGIFSSRSSKVSIIANAQGEASEEYNDRSLDNAVITANVSATAEDAQTIPFSYYNTLIDTTDGGLWNIALVTGSLPEDAFLPPNENGLPIFSNMGGAEEAAVYKESFNGSTIVAKYGVHLKECSSSSVNSGKINFVIQQYNNQPNQHDWGYYQAYQEGIPHSTKVISSEINYFSGGFYLVSGNSYMDATQTSFYNMSVESTRKEFWHVWFVISEGKAQVFTSNQSYRPVRPILELEDPWGDIDPKLPFWIGFGSPNNNTPCTGYIERMWATAED